MYILSLRKHLMDKTFSSNIALSSLSFRCSTIIITNPHRSCVNSIVSFCYVCIYIWKSRIALRHLVLFPAHFEALSAARTGAGSPATFMSHCTKSLLKNFQRDPLHYFPVLYLKCHTWQQIAQRLAGCARD